MVDDVLRSPQARQGRYRHQQEPAGPEQPDRLAEPPAVVVEVLEHVEREHRIDRRRRERQRLEVADDVLEPRHRTARVDGIRIDPDDAARGARDRPQPHQALGGAAADRGDPPGRALAELAAEHLHEDPLPASEPPVPLLEAAVSLGVLAVHRPFRVEPSPAGPGGRGPLLRPAPRRQSPCATERCTGDGSGPRRRRGSGTRPRRPA